MHQISVVVVVERPHVLGRVLADPLQKSGIVLAKILTSHGLSVPSCFAPLLARTDGVSTQFFASPVRYPSQLDALSLYTPYNLVI